MEAREKEGGITIYGASSVRPLDLKSDHPTVTYSIDGKLHTLECDYIAGCDGYPGVSRSCIPFAELDYYTGSRAGRGTIAENYLGLPYESCEAGVNARGRV